MIGEAMASKYWNSWSRQRIMTFFRDMLGMPSYAMIHAGAGTGTEMDFYPSLNFDLFTGVEFHIVPFVDDMFILDLFAQLVKYHNLGNLNLESTVDAIDLSMKELTRRRNAWTK